MHIPATPLDIAACSFSAWHIKFASVLYSGFTSIFMRTWFWTCHNGHIGTFAVLRSGCQYPKPSGTYMIALVSSILTMWYSDTCLVNFQTTDLLPLPRLPVDTFHCQLGCGRAKVSSMLSVWTQLIQLFRDRRRLTVGDKIQPSAQPVPNHWLGRSQRAG